MSDWELDSPANPASPQMERQAADQGGGPTLRAAKRAPKEGPVPVVLPPQGQPGSSRSLRTRVPWGRAGIVFAVLFVGIMAGFFLGRYEYSGDSAALVEANARVGDLKFALTGSEDRNWTYYRAIEGLKAELEQAKSSTSTTVLTAGGVRDTYSDGVYLVGKDIPAGTYIGAVNGGLGYWARLKGTDGAISSIIDNAIPRGPFVLTIVEADKAVELRGVTLIPR